MRDLTTNELNQVAGGIGGISLAFNQPLGSIPVLSLTFNELTSQGTLTFNGMTQLIGLGHPAIKLP
jgi:hypothetical protein